MSRFAKFALSLAVAAGVALSAGVAQAAQPAPQPVTLACATDMRIQMLGKTDPANAEGQSLVLVRAYFGVGGGIGAHTHPCNLIVVVEEGQFGVTLEEEGMEMMVMRASDDAATPAAAEPLVAGQETVLEPGDWFIETGMVHSARNAGDEPVTVLFTGLVTAGEPVTSCA